MADYLLNRFKGGVDLEDKGDKTAISEDHTQTWGGIMDLAATGAAQNAYQTLQANDVFDNKDFLAADEFLDADGTNNTVDTFDPTDATVHVIVEATSIPAVAINNCLARTLSTGRFLIYCTVGTDEVRRAQIYKTLFYGTTGADSIAASIVSCTAILTTETRDVDKRAYYADALVTNWGGSAGGSLLTYTGTFANTTTNNDFSSWSICVGASDPGDPTGRWEVPSATILNTQTGGTSDETGTDLTADETDNPATCQLENILVSGSSSASSSVKSYMLCEGALSFVEVETITGSGFSTSEIDFFTTHSIPLFTLSSETLMGTTAVFNTNLYECQGGAGSYADSEVLINNGVKTLDGTELTICVYGDVTNTANTTTTVDIIVGAVTLSAQPLNTAIGLLGFVAGNLEVVANLNTTDVNDTPTISGYGVIIK